MLPPKQSTSLFLLGVLFGFAASSLVFLSVFDVVFEVPGSSSGQSTRIESPLFPLQVFQQQTRTVGTDLSRKDDNVDGRNENGWKTIHVFAGDKAHILDASTIPNDYYPTTPWFSQLRQDQIVSSLLNGKRNGYFVDLAANDAIRISNTYALERDFGWTGLCIEPNPVYWSSLSYRQCQTVAAVVGHTRMQEVLFKFGSKGPQGGIVGAAFRNKEPIHNREEKRRSTVTLQEIFERFHTPLIVDYLSLDLEGAEEYVMESFPFDRYRFNVLTIEDPSTKLQEILKRYDYVFLQQLRRVKETLWVHRDMLGSINRSALNIEIPKYSERVARPKVRSH